MNSSSNEPLIKSENGERNETAKKNLKYVTRVSFIMMMLSKKNNHKWHSTKMTVIAKKET